MASMRDIKSRIKSVGNTQQITKAMNLVAASKLQKAKIRLSDTRPFFNETKRVIATIVNSSKNIKHSFLTSRDVKNIAVIIISSDRGLCGGYNANINKEVAGLINDKSEKLITIGNKSKDYFKRRNKNIVKSYTGVSEKPTYEDANNIGILITDMFAKGEADEIYLAYTEFKSTISHEPKITKILPLDASAFTIDENEIGFFNMMYEPDEESVLDYIIPKYINTIIFGAMTESSACEQGARMTSMDSATENASDMISSLTLKYNRARQGAITQEITEIVSGANALE